MIRKVTFGSFRFQRADSFFGFFELLQDQWLKIENVFLFLGMHIIGGETIEWEWGALV